MEGRVYGRFDKLMERLANTKVVEICVWFGLNG